MNDFTKFILYRLLLAVVVLVAVAYVVYRIEFLLPSPISTVDSIQSTLEPPRFDQWLQGVTRGEFGLSLRFREPAWQIFSERFAATTELFGFAFVLVIVGGVLVGVLMAYLRYWLTDSFIRVFAILALSFPVMWLGFMLIYHYAFVLGGSPIGGRCAPIRGGCPPLTARLNYLFIPLMALTIFWGAALAVYIRNVILAGHREANVPSFSKEVVRKAVLKYTPLSFTVLTAGLISSLVLIETIFSWPGIGLISTNSLITQDHPVILTIVLVMTTLVCGVYFASNLLYAVIARFFGEKPQGYTVTALPYPLIVGEQQAYAIPARPEPTSSRKTLNNLWTAFAVITTLIVVGVVMESNNPTILTNADPLLTNPPERLLPPDETHRLGTDELGRDVLVRLLVGGKTTLDIAYRVALNALLIGGILGIIGGLFEGIIGGIVNAPINAAITVVTVFPPLLLMPLMLAIFLPGSDSEVRKEDVLVTLFTFIAWANVVPIVRAKVRDLRRDFTVEYKKKRGVRTSFTGSELRHTVLNACVGLVVVAGFGLALNMAAFILLEVAVSFLGIGIQPPTPSWGNLLANSFTYLRQAPHLMFVPGMLITLTVFCLYVIAERIRDTFDFTMAG